MPLISDANKILSGDRKFNDFVFFGGKKTNKSCTLIPAPSPLKKKHVNTIRFFRPRQCACVVQS